MLEVPSGNITAGNDHRNSGCSDLEMAVFHSYVSLPEGSWKMLEVFTWGDNPCPDRAANTFGHDSYRDHSTKFHVFDVC